VQSLLTTQRAISELKRGLPVVITNGNDGLLAMASEQLGEDSAIWTNHKQWFITLSEQRTAVITGNKQNHATCLPFDMHDIHKLDDLLWHNHTVSINNSEQASDLQSAALLLASHAQLLPSVITSHDLTNCDNLVRIATTDIHQFEDNYANSLNIATQTPLALKASEHASIVAFRAISSDIQHYAIIIGQPQNNALVRIHSSCYTGDLLASLACDCGDQLHLALERMALEGSGIILYMMQEGRGIGLINKLRAYAIKETGLDTVDANRMLGFDDDARNFKAAAKMLSLLGLSEVRLLSNNPRKSKGLEECSIKVSECVPHEMDANTHNHTYLKSKADRLGHTLKKL